MQDSRKKNLKQPAIFTVAWKKLMPEVRVGGFVCYYNGVLWLY